MPDLNSAGRAAGEAECDNAGTALRAWPAALVACFMMFSITACGGGGGGGATDTGGDTGGDYTDDGDTGDTGDTGDSGDDTAVQASLDSIQENVFTPICTECHTGASAPQGLRLEEGMSYGMLVNVASSEVPELMRVEPGNPDDSYLIQKLEGTAAVGERMPLGGPYLSQDTIDAIRQWITDGASETAVAAMPATGKTSLTAAWPVPDSTVNRASSGVVLIADGELDTSLLHAGSVQVARLAGNGVEQLMTNVELRVTSLSPTVINLRGQEGDWAPGRYEVRVMGSGSSPVADRGGRLIDGDGDGTPGGDFVYQFTVGGE